MSKKLLVAVLAVSAAINLVAIFTFGSYWREESVRRHQLPPPRRVESREQALKQLQERFQLTSAQLDTIRVLDEFRHATLRPVRERLDSHQVEIRQQLSAPNLDQSSVDRLLRSIVAAQDSLETGALGILLRMRSALTPQQRNRLPELFEELQRPGPGQGPGPGPQPGRPPRDEPPAERPRR